MLPFSCFIFQFLISVDPHLATDHWVTYSDWKDGERERKKMRLQHGHNYCNPAALDGNDVFPIQRLLIACLGSVYVVWTSWPGSVCPPLRAAVRGCWFAWWCWRYSRAEDTPCTATGPSPVQPSSSPSLCASPHRHVVHNQMAGRNDSAPVSSGDRKSVV